MTDKHTPGPWRWVPQPDYSWQYQDLMSASGEVVLSGEEAPDPSGIELSRADARLIESAPEMLEALEGYISDCTNDECERCIKARAAIAKVRGTQ
jgi:hypothetical protein